MARIALNSAVPDSSPGFSRSFISLPAITSSSQFCAAAYEASSNSSGSATSVLISPATAPKQSRARVRQDEDTGPLGKRDRADFFPLAGEKVIRERDQVRTGHAQPASGEIGAAVTPDPGQQNLVEDVLIKLRSTAVRHGGVQLTHFGGRRRRFWRLGLVEIEQGAVSLHPYVRIATAD